MNTTEKTQPPGRKREPVVRLDHEKLDRLLGSDGSDLRKARIQIIISEFARRGMHLKIYDVAKGRAGLSAAAIYVLAKSLGLRVEELVVDGVDDYISAMDSIKETDDA